MTVYETLSLMIAFGLLIVSLLSFHKRIDRPCPEDRGLFLIVVPIEPITP